MALFSSESLNQLRLAALAARRFHRGMASPASPRLPTGGTDVTGSRDYVPGDDLRRVDWNVCARHDELVVKEYWGEADEHFYVLLDASASMRAGAPSKFDVARLSVAALAYVAMARMARFVVFAFADRIGQVSTPLRDKSRVVRLLSFLERLSTESPSENCRQGGGQADLSSSPQNESTPDGVRTGSRDAPTDLFRVTEAFVRRRQRRGPVVVVSDFFDPRGFRNGLDVLRRSGYSPRMIRIHDPADADPDVLGDAELIDAESGSLWQVTVTERHVNRFRQLYADHRRALRRYAATYSIPYVEICTNLSQEQALLKAVGGRL